MPWDPEQELARLQALGIGTGEMPVVGGLGLGAGPLSEDSVRGGLEPEPSGGFWGGVKRFASAAAPYVRQGLGFAGDVAMNLSTGDPNTATRGRLAIEESNQRGASLALQESRDRIAAMRELQMQRVYDAMQKSPPKTVEERQRYAMMLAPYDPRMASVLMKTDATAIEPSEVVNQGGKGIIVPRSESWGKERYQAPKEPRSNFTESRDRENVDAAWQMFKSSGKSFNDWADEAIQFGPGWPIVQQAMRHPDFKPGAQPEASEAVPEPLTDQTKPVKDKLYQDSKGDVRRWDGEHFVPVK